MYKNKKIQSYLLFFIKRPVCFFSKRLPNLCDMISAGGFLSLSSKWTLPDAKICPSELNIAGICFYRPGSEGSAFARVWQSLCQWVGECIPACSWAGVVRTEGVYVDGGIHYPVPPAYPQETKIDAVGTHPTGMHSCCLFVCFVYCLCSGRGCRYVWCFSAISFDDLA